MAAAVCTSAQGYLAKARHLEEHLRIAHKRHQEEIILEKSHLEFLENCLAMLTANKEIIKQRAYSPENIRKSKYGLLSTSFDDKSRSFGSSSRLLYLPDRQEYGQVQGSTDQRSGHAQKNSLSQQGRERWRNLQSSIKEGTLETFGRKVKPQLGHSREKDVRMTVVDSTDIAPISRLQKSVTSPKYRDQSHSSKDANNFSSFHQQEREIETKRSFKKSIDWKESPVRKTAINTNEQLDSNLRVREGTPNIQINFISERVFASKKHQCLNSTESPKKTSIHGSGAGIKKLKASKKALEIEILNEGGSTSTNRLTNLYSVKSKPSANPSLLLSPKITEKRPFNHLRKLATISSLENTGTNRSMLTPKVTDSLRKKGSLALSPKTGSFLKKHQN